MESGIYKITSPTGRVYIGQAINIKQRFKRYERLDFKGQRRLFSSVVKYGLKNHTFEIVEKCIEDTLNQRERFWQDYYEVTGKKGLNCKLTQTEDKSGHLSQAIKDKISKGNKGKLRTKETLLKLSQVHQGFKVSEETKQKLSIKNKGKKPHINAIIGVKVALSKTYLFTDPQGNKIEIYNMKEFCHLHNLSPSKMCLVFQGKRNHHKGWKLYLTKT